MRISRSQVLAVVRSALNSPATTTRLVVPSISLHADERDRLERWLRSTTISQRVVTRTAIVLLFASGWPAARIAATLGISRHTVALWKARFVERGSATLHVDALGRGRKRGRNPLVVARIAEMTNQRPPCGEQWTVRTLARTVGVSHVTVHRVWREQQIGPSARQVAN